MKSKKGDISPLVATVLLILITVSAIGIMGGVIMPKLFQAKQEAQNEINQINQTIENQTNPHLQPYIDLCKKNCEELGLEYWKLLDDIMYNPTGCYCRNYNGLSDGLIRIW